MPKTSDPDSQRPPTKQEKQHLKELVSGIVVVQGNLFIKELLRKHSITIGRTKADFEKNLLDAVEDGRLRLADVEAWLSEVEGWGDQHAYLWKLHPSVLPDEVFTSEAALRKRLAHAKLAHLLGAATTHAFPDEEALSGIERSDDWIRLVWHKGVESWTRATEKDIAPQEEDDGETYKYHAYRQRRDRSVARLELRRKPRIAAVFLQIPWDRNAHRDALDVITKAARPFVDIDRLQAVGLSDAIKALEKPALDDKEAKARRLTPERTRMSDNLAAIEFSSLSKGHGYVESVPIRRARKALDEKGVAGTMGLFSWSRGEKIPAARFGLFSLEGRIHLHAQLHAEEVWEILELVQRVG